MPTTELTPAGNCPAAAPIHSATLLDVVLKSQGTARLKRRVASRLVFAQITVDDYVSDREAVRQRLLSVPVFGSSSLIELDMVLASFVERQVISVPTDETPYRLPEALAELTVSTLLMEAILPSSLTRLIQATPDVGAYRLQAILDDRWGFQEALHRARSVGKAKAQAVDEAISRFIDDVKAIGSQRPPTRDYNVYSSADLLPPVAALDWCIDKLTQPHGMIIRDRFGIGAGGSAPSASILEIARTCGMSRYACTSALKIAMTKLSAGPSFRAAKRMLAEPIGVAARNAAGKVLKPPVKDAQVENYLRDEPYLRLAVVIAHKRPSEWIGKRSSG
jgi:hypothetical protein